MASRTAIHIKEGIPVLTEEGNRISRCYPISDGIVRCLEGLHGDKSTIISRSPWKGSGPSLVTGPHQRLARASPFQLGKKALRFQPTIFVDHVLTFYGDSVSSN